MQNIHIMLQGFGSFPLNFRGLIEESRKAGDPITWSIICTGGHYVEMYKKLLGADAVLYLHSDMKRYLKDPDLLRKVSAYQGNIYRNIESEKRFTKHKTSMRQLRSAAAMYLSVKAFMEKRQPTHMLFGQIEGLDGMTMISVGQELGVPALVPSHTRHLGETFLSPDHVETLPAGHPVTDEHRAKARAVIERFRARQTSAGGIPAELKDGPTESYPTDQKPFMKRVIGTIRRLIAEPEMREPDVFRASILINFPFIANTIWETRRFFNRRIYDIERLDQLPESFAYYPLQYSPESSINTPAPYFVDQMRAIDAIRFALPPGMMLVVKEHPACMTIRPPSFLKTLQKKAGVVLARYTVNSRDITERAAITFSVSGTAALESFMMGRPALTLGGAYFAEFLGGATGVDALPERIRAALAQPPSEDYIVESLARVYAASSPFITGSPFDAGSGFTPYSLRKNNIRNFYAAVKREVGL